MVSEYTNRRVLECHIYKCILNYFQINKDNINLENLRSFFSKFSHNENSLFSKVFKYKES